MIYVEEIKSLVEPIVAAEGMELVDLECLKMKTRWLVRLYIDKAGGVTIDDCSVVSHHVGDVLDVHDLPPGPFTLEVSSPGFDRPLAKDADFLKYRGHRIKLKLDKPVEGSKNITGVLVDYAVTDEGKLISVAASNRTIVVPRELVRKANLATS